MKTIELSRGLVALVDDEDFEWLSQWNWCAQSPKSASYAYAFRSRLKSEAKSLPSTIYMHRVIMRPPKGMVCDHVNRNGLDNRRKNLRVCTSAENSRNLVNSQNPSLPRGVYFLKGRYRAEIQSNTKRYRLGGFDTPEEAGRAYDEAAKRLHGEFAILNGDSLKSLTVKRREPVEAG